jgi:hypothetical protein
MGGPERHEILVRKYWSGGRCFGGRGIGRVPT